MFTGLALEGGTTLFVRETLGALALAGGALQLGRWTLEANLGAGIDLIEEQSSVSTDTQQPGGGFATTMLQSAPVSRVGLFAAASLAVAHPLFASFEGVLTIDGHQSLVNQMDGYLAATLGLRYRL